MLAEDNELRTNWWRNRRKCRNVSTWRLRCCRFLCLGIVEKDEIIDGSKIKDGDKIIALPSSGFHSNGFSLVRKIFPDFE